VDGWPNSVKEAFDSLFLVFSWFIKRAPREDVSIDEGEISSSITQFIQTACQTATKFAETAKFG